MKLPQKIANVLEKVLKPGRYIGNEINSIKKEWKKENVNFLLIFPEVYEIGMSNVGLKILYSILNKEEYINAERAYTPWLDMADEMRKSDITLYSLENYKNADEFDIIGFSLESDLTYTNIPETLDLAGIPIFSSDREVDAPIVLAGGPCVFNPEPSSPFFDLMLIGDGEEAVIEISKKMKEIKNKKFGSRLEKLLEFSEIRGIYIPQAFEPKYSESGSFLGMKKNTMKELNDSSEVKDKLEKIPEKIKKAVVKKLSDKNYFNDQIIPFINIVHDRYPVEIMRGCVRGCRFCQAGMIYRPSRERESSEIKNLIEYEVEKNLPREISFLSLSSSDYTGLDNLMLGTAPYLNEKKLSLSIPSTRVDNFSDKMAENLRNVKMSGLTFAPEAGTERLRKIINKNLTEEEIIKGIEKTFKKGWKICKLYFMVGLPFETDEDIKGISELIQKCFHIGKKYNKSSKINVTLSPFVPKAHTPFQWAGQISPEEMFRRIKIVLDDCRKYRRGKLEINWHEPFMSYIEALLSQGDRRTGELIFKAWKLGARFDQWRESFNPDIWKKAIEDWEMDAEYYLREKSRDEVLFWDHIDSLVSKEYLVSEWNKSEQCAQTEDCKTGKCSVCGVCSGEIKNIRNETELPEYKSEKRIIEENDNVFKYRLSFKREGNLRFISHLDTVSLIEYIIRVNGLDIAFSGGFHKRMKIVYSPPLPLFYESPNEYIDVSLHRGESLDELLDKFNVFKSFLEFTDIMEIKDKKTNINRPDYILFGIKSKGSIPLEEGLEVFRKSYEEDREDFKSFDPEFWISNDELKLLIKVKKSGKIIRADKLFDEDLAREFNYRRIELLIKDSGVFYNMFRKEIVLDN